jgi:hypothetical protein
MYFEYYNKRFEVVAILILNKLRFGYFHRSTCLRKCPSWDSDKENRPAALDCVTNI